MRDRTVGETFYLYFTTRAFATGIPTVLAGTPVVSAYEDNSVTQITAGITLGVSHDSVVGLNLLTIVATGGNGFEAGKDYSLVITTGTVGGVSVVGEVVGEFALGLSAAFTRLGAPAGASIAADLVVIDNFVDGLETTIGTAGDGLTAINLPNQTMDIVGSITGNLSGSVGSVTGAVGSLTGHTNQTGDSFAIVNGTAGLVAIDTVVDAIKAVTDLLPDAGALDDLAAILTDTGTTLPATLAALNNVSVADILTTQMTEAYAADGVAPTLAQAMFFIMQNASEFAIAGTTITMKKLDGSTTAATFTLDDSADPTSRTRTT